MSDTAELPSLRLRRRLLAAMLSVAPKLGWTSTGLRAAAAEAGLSEGECALAAPRGAIDLIDAFAIQADDEMARALETMDIGAMRIREKVRAAVWSRIEWTEPHRTALARAAAVLALPNRAPDAARIAWRTADRIWTALGDRSTDENYYSKRAILAGLHASVVARWLLDEDPMRQATQAFLDARIENVMQFEKLKAQARHVPNLAEAALGALASLRYR